MVTNMALAQRKVLILAADDFEDMEPLYPLYRLAEEDADLGPWMKALLKAIELKALAVG
jgi:putative intracellular protease/amidase